MSHRIFISSVMRDFAAERAAAKDAVTRLRQQPVMAEDFGAQPISSQTACLEGVRSSHIYIGIFGPRYGYVAPSSGRAATEEEFNEARRCGLPILCFEKKGSKEPPQELFLQRIKAYETGYSFASFDTPEELKMAVVQALNDQIGRPDVSALDSAGAAAALDRHRWGSRRSDRTWLGAVLLPTRHGESFLDVLEFGRRELRDRLLQPACFGSSPLFRLELGTRTAEEGDALVFRQEDERRQNAAALEIHADGALVSGAALSRVADDTSLARIHIIDEDEVERRLVAFATYAGQFYQGLDRGELITSLYAGVSLTGIQYKTFGKLPSHPLTSIQMPSHGLPDPLKIPTTPLRVPRAELADPAALARKLTGHIARAFRSANASFTSGVAPRWGGPFGFPE
jgi:hypothetical protein